MSEKEAPQKQNLSTKNYQALLKKTQIKSDL